MDIVQPPPRDNLEYKKVGPGHYMKWNPVLGVRSQIWVTPSAIPGKVDVHTRHDQPKQLVEDILDRNVAMQNDFSGYRGKDIVQGTAIPLVQHKQIMKQCGFQAGHGYDEKRFKQIVNDIDYRKFKTVPGKI